MSKISENQVTAALTFAVPKKVGWSVQSNDKSWTGDEILGLVDCLAIEGPGQSVTLSLSLIVELPGNDGTVRS